MLIEVPASQAATILAGLEEKAHREAEHAAEIKKLNCEKDLTWVEQRYRGLLMGRESYYSTADFCSAWYDRCQIREYADANDPPVVMRGSKYRCHTKYCRTTGGDNVYGWCNRVAIRYVKMTGLTCFIHHHMHASDLGHKHYRQVAENIVNYYRRQPGHISYFTSPLGMPWKGKVSHVLYIDGEDIGYKVDWKNISSAALLRLAKKVNQLNQLKF